MERPEPSVQPDNTQHAGQRDQVKDSSCPERGETVQPVALGKDGNADQAENSRKEGGAVVAADDQIFLIVQTDQGAHFKIVFYGPDTVKIDYDGFADPDEAEASKTFFCFLQGEENLVHLLLQAGEGAFFHGFKIENVGDGKRSFRTVLYSHKPFSRIFKQPGRPENLIGCRLAVNLRMILCDRRIFKD